MKHFLVFISLTLGLFSTASAVRKTNVFWEKTYLETEGHFYRCFDGYGGQSLDCLTPASLLEESDLPGIEARINANVLSKIEESKKIVLQAQGKGINSLLKSDELRDLIRQIIREEIQNAN